MSSVVCCNYQLHHMRPLFLYPKHESITFSLFFFKFSLTNSSSILKLNFQHLHGGRNNNLQSNQINDES